MHRSPPPRGRYRARLLVTLLVSVLLGVPALAGAEPEPGVTLPGSVTGEDFLTLSITAGKAPYSVQIRDAEGDVSRWTVTADDLDDAGTAAIDLSAPDDGSRPVNGRATATVTSAPRVLLETPLVIDQDPPTPALAAVARPGTVRLSWTPVAGPGPVTYRLQRSAGGDWSTVLEDTGSAYVDRDLEPGRYRYRLVAMVPAAARGVNTSTASAAGVVVPAPAEPEPSPSPEPQATNAPDRPRPNATAPAIPKPKIPELPPRPRKVRVAGNPAEGITPLPDQRERPRRRPVQYSAAPALGGLQSSSAARITAAAPVIADRAPRPRPVAAPTVAPRDPVLPVTVPPVAVPPAGTLALHEAGDPTPYRDLAPMAGALILLLFASHAGVRWVGARVSSAADDRP